MKKNSNEKIFYKKRWMTLLEVLLAMSLTSILLIGLFWIYRDANYLNRETKRIQKENFQMNYVENRLSSIFLTALSENNEKKDFIFFTENKDIFGIAKGKSLVLLYNNGNHIDPDFCGHVMTRIYLDQNEQLCLMTWPSIYKTELKDPYKCVKEILLENVTDIQFKFFVPPSDKVEILEVKTKGQKIKPLYSPDWLDEWKNDYQQLPAIVKVIVEKSLKKSESEKNIFVYPLSDNGKEDAYFIKLKG